MHCSLARAFNKMGAMHVFFFSRTPNISKPDCVTFELYNNSVLLIKNSFLVTALVSILRDCKYRESVDRLKKSQILITCQKNTFGKLSSKILFKLSGTLLFSRNSEKRFCLINYAKIRLKIKRIACACL